MNIYIRYFFFLFLFITLFFIIHILKRNIYPNEIIFYEGISIIIFLTFIYIILFLILRKLNINILIFRDIHIFVFALISYFFIVYSYLITIPTMVDRSLSLYIIKEISKKNENGLNNNQLISSIQKEFLINNDQYNKRIAEQLKSGNIYIKDDILFITKKGKINNKINIFLKKILNI